MGAGATMADALGGATTVLRNMNKNISLPALQRIAMEFERETDLMDQRQEIMDDAMDEATGVDEEEEQDEILDKVLEEIGVGLKHSVNDCQGLCQTVLTTCRWERHLKDFKEQLLRRAKLRRLSVVGILEMMTYKPG